MHRRRAALRPVRSNCQLLTAAILGAAAAASVSQTASAQTWLNPTTGNWNNAANWTGGLPAAANTTALAFEATGSQTYTASNDIANPFLLNAINFANTGTGNINLDGSALQFDGAAAAINVAGAGIHNVANAVQIVSGADQTPLTLGGAGAGVLNLTGALSSTPAATGTAGGYVLQNNPNATANLSGGGALYGLAVAQGTMNVTGGAYALSSTERGNDVVGAVNDGGLWGISVGRVAGQTGRFTLGTGVTITANSAMFGDAAGATGTGTISGGTLTMPQTGNVFFGVNAGTGAANVVNGGRVVTNFFEIGRQAGVVATALIDGAGSRVDASQMVARNGVSTTTISNGGVVNIGTTTSNGNVFIASTANSTATLLISSGGQLVQGNQQTAGSGTNSVAVVEITGGGKWESNGGNSFLASSTTSGNPIPGRASITVSGAGSAYNTNRIGTVGGQQSVGTSGDATFTVQNGAAAVAYNTFVGNFGFGTLNLNAATFNNGNQLSLRGQNVDTTKISTLRVENGGVFNNLGSAFVSSQPLDRTQILLNGGTLNIGTVLVAGGGGGTLDGGASTINVTGGGRLAAERLTFG